MDITSVPRIDSIVLTGLDYSMKPEHVRFETRKEFIKPFPEIKVMHLIKSLAVMVYNQEKMTPYYHGNVCDGRNSLAYFICAVHRQSAPQPMTKTHSRHNSGTSEQSKHNSTFCNAEQPGKNCELPKLCTTSMLPLGYWDSLYYALVAEIRVLRNDLESRFGFACENENPILHYHGQDGTSDQPVSAIEFASMLETAWYALMDNRLVATLDDAVRMRQLHEGSTQTESTSLGKDGNDNGEKIKSEDEHDNSNDQGHVAWPPPILPGLIDICGMEPEAVNDMLWTKHMPAINRACLEDFEDESMLTAYRAEVRAKEVEAAIAAGTPLPSANFCPCHRTCVCKLKCDKDSEQCTCLNSRAQIYHLVREQESKKHEIHTKYVKAYQNVPNQFLGASTNVLAQMQVAAMADPTDVNVQACRSIHEAGSAQELHIAKKLRERTNTNDSQLAYVPPPKSSGRGPKDAYPLGFYNSYSPERYPRMNRKGSTSQPASQLPTFDQMYGLSSVPTRKPVPPPLIMSTDPYDRSNSQSGYHRQAYTPPSSALYGPRPPSQAEGVMYPAIPASQSQTIFTQSFPMSDAGNPREVRSNPFSDQPIVAPNYQDPAQDYINLLARHPSSLEHTTTTQPPLPSLTRPPVATGPGKAATTNALPTLKTLDATAQSTLPQPDFIAPRPAIKQRYVSAGGNAKLSERAEIPGPALPASTAATGGGSISKEELDAMLNDVEWVRRNFGDAAAMGVPDADGSPMRRSVESSKRSSAARPSGDSDYVQGGDKRDRTSSSASKKVAKLKRVFGRKDSLSED